MEILRNLLGEVPYLRLNLGDRLGERRDVGAAVGLRKIGGEAAHEVFEGGHLFARDEVSEGGAQAPDLSLDALERGMPRVGRRVLPLEAGGECGKVAANCGKRVREIGRRPRYPALHPVQADLKGLEGIGQRGGEALLLLGGAMGGFAEPGFGLFDPVGHRDRSKGGAPGRVRGLGGRRRKRIEIYACAVAGDPGDLGEGGVEIALARAAPA